MNEEMFHDKTIEPDDHIMQSLIGSTMALFLGLRAFVNANYTSITEEWKYYGQKHGWQLKMFYKKRNLFFLLPKKGYFMIAFVFGDNAVQAIEQSDLPKEIIETLVNAKKYMEGRGLPLDVKSIEDLELVKRLVKFKVG
ncbi:DUF3788 domain-containing protein [bacterium]